MRSTTIQDHQLHKMQNIFVFISVLCNSYFLIRVYPEPIPATLGKYHKRYTRQQRKSHTHAFIHTQGILEYPCTGMSGGWVEVLAETGRTCQTLQHWPWSCEVPTLPAGSPCCLTMKQVTLKSVIMTIRFLALVSSTYGFSLLCERAGVV